LEFASFSMALLLANTPVAPKVPEKFALCHNMKGGKALVDDVEETDRHHLVDSNNGARIMQLMLS
jgi:hypothetical protein